MNGFVNRATSKLSKLSDEEIQRLLKILNEKIDLRNSVLNNVNTGFLVVDKNLKVQFLNKYLSDILLFDLNSIDYGHTNVSKIIKDADLLKFISQNAGNISLDVFDYDVQSSLLGNLRLQVSAEKLENCNSILFKFLDMTLFVKFKKEFRKNESLASMTTMAAGVAHEIKNPLASISIYLQLLSKKLERDGQITQADASKSLSVISSEVERLNKIAVDFLFAVKPMNVDLTLFDLNKCVDSTCDIAKAELESKKINLIVNVGRSLPKVLLDKNLIEQSLLNLIRNAMQAIEGKDNGEIVINSFLDGDFVKLSVTDNGCGMTEEQMSKIFEPYYTTKPSGTGLGLTTIFKIMKEHDGEINTSSILGEGSVFTLQFPVPRSERFRIGQEE